MAKKEFKWDTEVLIGEVKETDKVTHEIKECKKGDKIFLVATKKILGSEGWKIVKHQTFEAGVFNQIVALVQDQEAK